MLSISLPTRSKGFAESTDSDSNYDREYIPGLRESGEIELTFRHDPEDPGQDALENNFYVNGNAAVVTCILTLPDDAVASSGITRQYTFDGFVISPPQGDLNMADDTTAEVSATVKVAGAVSLSSA
jgi:hypothetical protein